jgi:hypothetical protein
MYWLWRLYWFLRAAGCDHKFEMDMVLSSFNHTNYFAHCTKCGKEKFRAEEN